MSSKRGCQLSELSSLTRMDTLINQKENQRIYGEAFLLIDNVIYTSLTLCNHHKSKFNFELKCCAMCSHKINKDVDYRITIQSK